MIPRIDPSTSDLISRSVSISGFLGAVAYDPDYTLPQGLWRPFDYKQLDENWLHLAPSADRLGIYVIGPQESGVGFPFADAEIDQDERITKITQIKNAAIDKYNEQMELKGIKK